MIKTDTNSTAVDSAASLSFIVIIFRRQGPAGPSEAVASISGTRPRAQDRREIGGGMGGVAGFEGQVDGRRLRLPPPATPAFQHRALRLEEMMPGSWRGGLRAVETAVTSPKSNDGCF